MFTKEKKELQKTIDVYVKKVPESLTSQFTNRRTRTEAIDMQKKRRSMETLLHPPCKKIIQSNLYNYRILPALHLTL